MPYRRSYRRMGRRSGPRPFVKTFKKVINSALASVTSGTNTETLAVGRDAQSPRQVTTLDPDVPTARVSVFVPEVTLASAEFMTFLKVFTKGLGPLLLPIRRYERR